MSGEDTFMERSLLVYKVQESNKWYKMSFSWRRVWMLVMRKTVCLVTRETNLSSLLVVEHPQ